jgi:hypothetical protein
MTMRMNPLSIAVCAALGGHGTNYVIESSFEGGVVVIYPYYVINEGFEGI